MFITFEGIDGSGKSTQINLLSDYFKDLNLEPVILREPGGTELSEAIRDLLLNSDFNINSITELMLFEAARSELVDNIIKPALDDGKVVICDRFYDSTTAYQGYGRGIDIHTIGLFNELASRNIKPDVTFFLDLPHHIAQERSLNRKPDNIESSGEDFFHRVYKGFLSIARLEKNRVVIVDAAGTVRDTHLTIVTELEKRFSKKLDIK